MHEFAALLLPVVGLFQAAPAPRAVEPPALISPASPELFSAPAAGEEAAEFRGFLSSWERRGEGLPRPLELDRAVTLRVRVPKKPGEAAAAKLAQRLGTLGVGVSIYAVCPHGSPTAADGSCERLYFQVQTALSGAAKAFCAAALSKHDALPFPVQQCGGPDSIEGDKIVGVTLHRVPFRP